MDQRGGLETMTRALASHIYLLAILRSSSYTNGVKRSKAVGSPSPQARMSAVISRDSPGVTFFPKKLFQPL
jgi:hypothetical protein